MEVGLWFFGRAIGCNFKKASNIWQKVHTFEVIDDHLHLNTLDNTAYARQNPSKL